MGWKMKPKERLSTTSCNRCAGLLVTEWEQELNNTGQQHIEFLRCVQCGQRIDPVILQNQIQQSVKRQPVTQVRHGYCVKTILRRHVA